MFSIFGSLIKVQFFESKKKKHACSLFLYKHMVEFLAESDQRSASQILSVVV